MSSPRRQAKQTIHRVFKELEEAIQVLEDANGPLTSEKLEFYPWFMKLLKLSIKHREFGGQHPMGTCQYRDVIRDKKVQEALQDAWQRIVVEDGDPIPMMTPTSILREHDE
jgi:hypothetical protein